MVIPIVNIMYKINVKNVTMACDVIW